MYWTNLDGKKIGIWGMGREGQSAKSALKKHCPHAMISEIGEDNVFDIETCDVLIKSPGVSLYRPEIQRALQKGVVVTSGTNLFFANKHSNTRVIAVTGTKGKSTTASLMAHTLKALGERVVLGGNIGRPLLDCIDEKADWVVAELSSYQCADFIGQPNIGVLVNLYPEHLQWHGSHDQYYQDKVHMVNQCGVVVLNGADSKTKEMPLQAEKIFSFNEIKGIHLQNGWFYDGSEPIFKREELHLKGDHNAENACAVLTVIKILGFPSKECGRAFQSFVALPHRLQHIGERDGIFYVDDSISTTPETAVAALKAINKGQAITLIAGGMDRGQDYAVLVAYLAQHRNTMRLVTLPDTGKRLAIQAQKMGVETSPTSDMPTAVSIAQHITPRGGVILLSPAAPSYNLYSNFEDRGDDFKKWAFKSE